MNEILEYPFAKPFILDRSEQALAAAEELRAKGCLTGVTCCLFCGMLSNFFFDGELHILTPKHFSSIQCPACGHVGSIFLHDYECLQSTQNSTNT